MRMLGQAIKDLVLKEHRQCWSLVSEEFVSPDWSDIEFITEETIRFWKATGLFLRLCLLWEIDVNEFIPTLLFLLPHLPNDFTKLPQSEFDKVLLKSTHSDFLRVVAPFLHQKLESWPQVPPEGLAYLPIDSDTAIIQLLYETCPNMTASLLLVSMHLIILM